MKRRDFLVNASAATASAVLARSAGATLLGPAPTNEKAVTFDERSVIVNGKRVLISCGEVHYARSTRAMWPKILQRSHDLGINTIATYVFWNRHETSRNVWDFAGERDLRHYLDLCQQKGPFCVSARWSVHLRGVELWRVSALSARRAGHHYPHHEQGILRAGRELLHEAG